MSESTNTLANGDGAPQRRRMSIADMFNTRPVNASSSPPTGIATAGLDTAQHRRGSSISSFLAGSSPNQASPYNAFARQRAASISGSSAASSPEFKNSFSDEHAVIEEDETAKNFGSPPSPSFARRLSFGAQALRDVRQSGQSNSNGGEGFNWSQSLRDQTKRSPSFSTGNPFSGNLGRVKSTPAGSASEPPKEMPKAAPPLASIKKPDHLGERMLRGDFMMD